MVRFILLYVALMLSASFYLCVLRLSAWLSESKKSIFVLCTIPNEHVLQSELKNAETVL